MTQIFGEFAWQINCITKEGIDNLKLWDNAIKTSSQTTKEMTSDQEKRIDGLQKQWQNFAKWATISFAGFTALIMKWSPHINAHTSLMMTQMKLLAIDIGATWAPAFKVATKAFGEFVSEWRRWGTVKKEADTAGGSAEGIWGLLGFSEMDIEIAQKAIHDFINAAVGILGAGIAVSFAFQKMGLSFNTFVVLYGKMAGVFATINTAMAAHFGATWLTASLTFLGYVGVFVALFAALGSAIEMWSKNSFEELNWFQKILATIGGVIAVTLHNIGQGFWWFANFIGYHLSSASIFFTKLQKSAQEALKATMEFFRLDTTAISASIETSQMQIYDAIQAQTNANSEMIKAEIAMQMASEGLAENMEKMWGVRPAAGSIAQDDFLSQQLSKINEIKEASIIEPFQSTASDASKWGEDLMKNYIEGIDSQEMLIKNKMQEVRSWITDPITFDGLANDMMAQKWGKDMITNFNKGARNEAKIVTQNVTQNLTIQSQSTTTLDAYGMVNPLQNMMSKQLTNIRGLGVQNV